MHEVDDWVRAQLAQASMGLSPVALVLAAADWGLHRGVSPGRQWALTQQVPTLASRAWQDASRPADPAAPAAAPDDRFADAQWNRWPSRALKSGFQASEAWWDDALQVPGLPPHHRQRVAFFAHQWLDTLSPSNGPATHPQVMHSSSICPPRRRWPRSRC